MLQTRQHLELKWCYSTLNKFLSVIIGPTLLKKYVSYALLKPRLTPDLDHKGRILLVTSDAKSLYMCCIQQYLFTSRFFKCKETQAIEMLGSLENRTILSLIRSLLRPAYALAHYICKVKSSSFRLIENPIKIIYRARMRII